MVILNDNDIAVNVAVGSNVVTIPPHSGLYDVLDNVVHGAYRSLIAIESYQQAEIYVLGLRYTRAGFEIIQPEHSNEEPVTSSASSNNGGNGSNGNSVGSAAYRCNAPGQTGHTPGQGGGNPGQGNGPGSKDGNSGA